MARWPVPWPGAPTQPLEAATKQYADEQIAGGGDFIDAPSDGTAYGRKDASWTGVVERDGDTMTGEL